ncbi:DUF6318 family protein [Arthrobacter sp. MYb222]|uniref:DUF6318 family protein n=1 Tax=Arthrobacter sp. MYb222 TaxID=1848599 RepID=UPI0011B04C6F|nr:DUF6318 family protein [Arthrobacter sp. MYb222]
MDTRKIAVVASVAAVALALSGCNAGNAEGPKSSPSTAAVNSSATPSGSATSSVGETHKYQPASATGPARNVPVPKMSAAAKKNSEEGATAFAEYYFEVINYVIQTNDGEPLKKSTTRQCEVCGKSLIDPAGRAQISGKWQVGGEHSYQVIDSYKSSNNKAVVTVRFEVAAANFYIKPNELESRKDKRPSKTAAIGMEYDSGWKVYIIDIETPSK